MERQKRSLVIEVGCSTVARPVRAPNKGVVVPRVVITHAVEDVDRWLQGKAVRAAAIQSGTGGNVTDYVAADGSKNVAITADVSDPATLQAMLASPPPEVLAAMQEHGVVQPISAYVER
jgi:hypothetical protein